LYVQATNFSLDVSVHAKLDIDFILEQIFDDSFFNDKANTKIDSTGKLLIRLAEYYLDANETDTSIRCAEAALEIFSRSENEHYWYIACLAVSDCYEAQEKYSKALKVRRKICLAYFGLHEDYVGEYARCLTKIGDVFYIRSRFFLAERFYREALRVCQTPKLLNATHEVANIEACISNCLEKAGKLHEAQRLRITQSIPKLRKIGANRDLLLVLLRYLEAAKFNRLDVGQENITYFDLIEECYLLAIGTGLEDRVASLNGALPSVRST
jgi:tetratricopeptide (TPR) repeat protein